MSPGKEAYFRYRERARDLYERAAVFHGEAHGGQRLLEEVTVPLHANVQVCEGGAYVEALAWVPDEKLERPTPIAAGAPAPTEGVQRDLLMVDWLQGH